MTIPAPWRKKVVGLSVINEPKLLTSIGLWAHRVLGFRVSDLGLRMVEFKISGLQVRVEGFRLLGLRLAVEGFSVLGLAFRVLVMENMK